MTPFEQGYQRTLKLAGLEEAYQRLTGQETDKQMMRHGGLALLGLGLAGNDISALREAASGEAEHPYLRGLSGLSGLGLTGHSLYRVGKGLNERYG